MRILNSSKLFANKYYKSIKLGIIIILALLCFKATIIDDTDWNRIGSFRLLYESLSAFIPPDLSILKYMIKPALETVMIAILGTSFSVIISIPIAWLGAINITPNKLIVYPMARSIMILSRSIHEFVWGLIFVSAVGLGALAGILAIGARSIGFMSKMIAESIENINNGPIEVIKAVGGGPVQVIIYGIIPQLLPIILSTIIFQFDINIRRSTIVGIVGAGGLGLTLQRQIILYNYRGVTTVLLSILAIVLFSEVIAHYIRKERI